MELIEIDELSEESVEGALSLDVKLAFNRVCSLIYSLKDDIGEEAASIQFQRICNDVDKVLSKKKNKVLYKENGFHQFSENDAVNTTVKSKGTHNFTSRSQYNVSTRPGCLQPYNGNVSCFSAMSETGPVPSFTNTLEEKKESSTKYQQQNDGTNSLFSKDALCTSFSSSFRPMVKNTLEAENDIQLGTIVEESRFEIDESEDSASEEQNNEEENCFFVLKSWSILLKDGDLLLSGIKMNEKGEILEKNFISKKVTARKERDKVKTLDGEFVLEGTLTDKNRIIPLEVKKQFFESEQFPRYWRKALNLWIELQATKAKEEKAKKKLLSQKKMKEEKPRKRSISPQKKMKDVSARKRSVSPNKKMKDEKPRKRSISPKKKMQNKKEVKESANKGKSPQVQSTSKSAKGQKKKEVKESANKRKSPQVKDTSKSAKGHDLEKNGTNKNEEAPEEHGPFSELLGDSLMILPTTSLTPNGLLSSIKKTVIKGRYTPPTSMFDNVYGNKSDHNSSLNTSFDDIGVVKNNHVVKRMCKVNNKKPKQRQNNKSPKHMMEEDEAINEILRVAKTKTNTTPSIIKHVFGAEKAEDSVNFSDLSDLEDV